MSGARRLLLALGATVALGLLSRLRPIGLPLYDKNLGDALYAVAVYLALALLLPRRSQAFVATAALAFCIAVELFQLTGLPARCARIAAVRWLLGTHFSLNDLLCYGAGIAAILLLDRFFIRPHK